jgi:hypothetical protein
MDTQKKESISIDSLPSYPTSVDVWPVILKNGIRNGIGFGDNLDMDVRRAGTENQRQDPHLHFLLEFEIS